HCSTPRVLFHHQDSLDIAKSDPVPMDQRTVRINGVDLETPRLALYTQCGSIPYLSWNFVRQHRRSILADDATEILKLNIGDFVELLDEGPSDDVAPLLSQTYFQALGPTVQSMLTQFDPMQSSSQVMKATGNAVPVRTFQGRRM